MRIAPAVALLAAVASATCSRGPANPARVRVDDLSVVLIVLDATAAKYVGVYGNRLPTTPHVDALARDGGTVFTRAYSQAAFTLPSTASLLTGRYPMRRLQTRTRVGGETLALAFRKARVATAAFSENPYVTTTYGFDTGFDAFREYFPESLLHQGNLAYTQSSEVPTSDAITWLAAHPDERAFVYLHLLRPHNPYDPPPPFGGRFDPDYAGTIEGTTDTLLKINDHAIDVTERDIEHLRLRYQENLAYGDHLVGRVVDALRRSGRLDRTIVVVTSDHGEAFYEHGVVLHTTTLFEEMIHVPLVVRFPPRFGPLPARFDGIVELRDLMPTLCHAAHLACALGTGRSLLRPLRMRTPPTPGVARSWTSPVGWLALGAIVVPDRKLIMDSVYRRLALFDLAGDPGEAHDFVLEDLRRAMHLARRLKRPRSTLAPAGRSVVDDDTARKLRALGYTAE
jgi:Sulfatase